MLRSKDLTDSDKQIFDLLDEGFVFLDDNLIPIWANKAMHRMLGPERVVGCGKKNVFEMNPEIAGTEWHDFWHTAQATRKPAVKQGFFGGRGFRASVAPTGEHGFVHVVLDITAEMSAWERQSDILYKMPAPSLIVRASDGVITFFNEAAQTISGGTMRVGQTIIQTWSIGPDHYYTDYSGKVLTAAELPVARAMRGERCPREGVDFNWYHGDSVTSLLVFWNTIPASSGHGDSIIFTYHDISRVAAAERKAQHLVNVRDDFISMASHELKTPLTSIKMITQHSKKLFDRGSLSRDRLQKLFETWSAQLDRFEGLIADMLDVSAIRNGKIKVSYTRQDLGEEVQRIVDQFSDDVEYSGTSIVGMWDLKRLHQIITNLITNGIKYGKGQKVTVQLTRSDNRATLSVSDLGIGIEDADKERIFQKFERVGHEDTVGGLGLGLYIVKQLVEAQGGEIEVRSVFGSGSTFVVHLPIKDSGL